jgi:hypothetical protein
MAKKSKRARAKVRVVQQVDTPESNISSFKNAGTILEVSKPLTGGLSAGMLANRHQHVIPELIRISIISAALFIILIVLYFVIG